MTLSRKSTALVVAAAAIGTGFAGASPAAAGGIIVVASPSYDNACANHNTRTQPDGNTSGESGSGTGLLTQLPLSTALNHCGGADLPHASNVEDVNQNNAAGAENTDSPY